MHDGPPAAQKHTSDSELQWHAVLLVVRMLQSLQIHFFFIRASSKFLSTCAARTIKKGPSMAHETQCSIAHESGPLSARSSALRAPLRNISPTQQQEVPSQVEQSFLKPRSGMTCQHPESLEVSNDWQLTRNLANRARLCQMLLDYVEQECHKMAWKGYVEEVVHQVCWGMVRAPSN